MEEEISKDHIEYVAKESGVSKDIVIKVLEADLKYLDEIVSLINRD